jgi:hypothetical protein
MGYPEVRKPVIVQWDPAGDPAVCRILLRKPLKLPSRSHSLNRCVQPKRQQNRRIWRRPSGLAFAGPDRRIKRRKVQALDKANHNARTMVARHQSVQIHKVPMRLRPICPNKPRFIRHRITSPLEQSESQHSVAPNIPVFPHTLVRRDDKRKPRKPGCGKKRERPWKT